MADARNNGAKTAKGQFAPGNPGRPKGARHKVTLAVEAILEGEAEKLGRKAVELALAGDVTALRLCIERIAPLRKGRPATFTVPLMGCAADIVSAIGAVVDAVASGELTTDEGLGVASLLEIKRKAIETAEIEARLSELEATHGKP